MKIKTISILIILLLAALIVRAQTALSVEQLLTRAKEAAAKGNLNKAARDCTQAIEIAPDSASAYFLRGAIYGLQRDRAKALANYNRALELDPQLVGALFERARIKSSFKDVAGTLEDLSAAIAVNPRDQTAYLVRADHEISVEKIAEAARDLETVVRLAPDTAQGVIAREWLRALRNQISLDEKLAALEAAAKNQPDNASLILINRGRLLLENQKYDLAMRDFDRAVAADRNNPMAYLNRAHGWRAQNEIERAIADYTEAIRLDSELAWAYLERGLLHLRQNDRPAAQVDFEKTLQLEPSFKSELENRIKAAANQQTP